MRLVLFIGILVLLGSCVTHQKCVEKFGWKDSDTIIYKDSLYIVHDTLYIPYQELSFDTSSPCPPQVVYHKKIKKGRQTLTIDIKNGKLTASCKEDSLMQIINNERRDKVKTVIKNNSETIIVKEVPWWSIALNWLNLFWILIIILMYFIFRSIKS